MAGLDRGFIERGGEETERRTTCAWTSLLLCAWSIAINFFISRFFPSKNSSTLSCV